MARISHRATRNAEDRAIRVELQQSIRETRALRARISDQWPQVLEITHITQPRLKANGFTEALSAIVHPRRAS